MYGGILTIDYQQKDNHLLLTLPGRYQVKQLDDHQVAVKSSTILVVKIQILVLFCASF